MRVSEINKRGVALETFAGDRFAVVGNQRKIQIRQMATHVCQVPGLFLVSATAQRGEYHSQREQGG